MIVAVVVALAGCSSPDSDRRAAAPAQPTRNAAMSAAPRAIGADERAAMLEVLRAESGNGRKVWFAVTPGNAETTAFKDTLAEIFKEAGWEPETQVVTGMNLKPGLFLMAAEEESAAVRRHGRQRASRRAASR